MADKYWIAAVLQSLEQSLAPVHHEVNELNWKAIFDRFGRYPHRNAILGRSTSAEELIFLSEPGSSF